MQTGIFVCIYCGLGGISKAGPEHAELLAFCKARDIDKAVAKLKQHILNSRDEIKAFLVLRESITA